MAISERQRRKQAAKAQQQLADALVREYAPAVTGSYPVAARWAMAGGYVGFVAVVFLLTGYVLVPGFLLMAFIASAINAPRGVVMTNMGVAVLKRSLVTGRLSQVLVRVSAGTLRDQVRATRSSRIQVGLGNEWLWMRTEDHQRLLSMASLAAAGAAAPRRVRFQI